MGSTRVAPWDRPDSPGASLAVARNGRIIYQDGFGSAQLEYRIPITPATIFHVASVSKQFTAFAMAMLAAQGKLSLDDDIRQHIPEVPDFDRPVPDISGMLVTTGRIRDVRFTRQGSAP